MAVLGPIVGLINFESRDFRRAAFLLWITPRLAARSSALNAPDRSLPARFAFFTTFL